MPLVGTLQISKRDMFWSLGRTVLVLPPAPSSNILYLKASPPHSFESFQNSQELRFCYLTEQAYSHVGFPVYIYQLIFGRAERLPHMGNSLPNVRFCSSFMTGSIKDLRERMRRQKKPLITKEHALCLTLQSFYFMVTTVPHVWSLFLASCGSDSIHTANVLNSKVRITSCSLHFQLFGSYHCCIYSKS